MLKKTMLAATALAVLAFAALPTIASARPHIDLIGEEKHFEVSGGAGTLTMGRTLNCESVSGTGEFEDPDEDWLVKTGWMELTFHDCTEEVLGSDCGTKKYDTRTIETGKLDFHLETTEGEPVVLITPETGTVDPETGEGHFATFKCVFGFITMAVEGEGVIGGIVHPAFEEKTDFMELEFQGDGEGAQEHTTVDAYPETDFDLTSAVNGGEPETLVIDTTMKTTLTEGALAEMLHTEAEE